jgi:ribosomal protein L11 methylase PrmA
MDKQIHKSSFRDPSGFLFYEDGKLFRQVNRCYQQDYDFLLGSGLYNKLCDNGLLVRHKEIEEHRGLNDSKYKIIEPELINFISYPYEWSFNQLKDAALLTLEIQKTALESGMTLKDASAFNIQFYKGRPVFIDTLSFEKYQEGKPWVAYRQFCQHFLAPLALMSHTDIRLNQLMKTYLDGIPLDLTSKLLPFRTLFDLSLLIHLHLHAKAQKKYEAKGSAARNIEIKKSNLVAMIQGLKSAVQKLKIKTRSTEWEDYYTFTNYSDKAFAHKKEIVTRITGNINPKIVWDLGANTGEFTKIAGDLGADCIAFDIDPLAVDTHYRYIRKKHIENILPLILDLTNPSPAIGWNNKERMGIRSRTLPDTVFVLALIHHLAISNNLPFHKIARFLRKLGENLVIEFIPKTDSQVKRLLETRKDIFDDYNEETFIKEFEKYYTVRTRENIIDSERIVFRMQRK